VRKAGREISLFSCIFIPILSTFFGVNIYNHHFCKQKSRTVKDDKKQLARRLYMAGDSQKEISERMGVSKQTLCRWVKDERWEELRAAQSITRPELINKILLSVNKMIDRALLESDDDNAGDMAGLADKLAKFASSIEKIDRKVSVVDKIESLMGFGKWLQYRIEVDKDIDVEFFRKVLKYQDMYVCELMAQAKGVA
jgi:transcriptional regulator with XRE-family HTH domain